MEEVKKRKEEESQRKRFCSLGNCSVAFSPLSLLYPSLQTPLHTCCEPPTEANSPHLLNVFSTLHFHGYIHAVSLDCLFPVITHCHYLFFLTIGVVLYSCL